MNKYFSALGIYIGIFLIIYELSMVIFSINADFKCGREGYQWPYSKVSPFFDYYCTGDRRP